MDCQDNIEDNIRVQEDTDTILLRHRQERKDLQATITALKKTIPKNDKKRKKQVADQITKLESDLEERQKAEISSRNQENIGESPPPIDNCLSLNSENESNAESEGRVTRAQRRRNKKENEDKERNKRILEQEEINRNGPRITELNLINTALKPLGLQIHNVPADGNCLYCSVKHQLEVTGRQSYKVPDLRKLTASFIRDNKDEFLPFMYNDNEEPVDESQFDKYCNDVAATKLWGGQLELRAMSNVLKCPIKIIQATGPPTIQGEQFEGEPLILTYHRHLYRLGEHYNSTIILDNNGGGGGGNNKFKGGSDELVDEEEELEVC